MDDAQQVFESLVQGLRGRSDEATLEGRLDACLSLARVGEGGVAVENLCSNLYEFQVPLAEQEHLTLVGLASRWGVARSTTEELNRLNPCPCR